MRSKEPFEFARGAFFCLDGAGIGEKKHRARNILDSMGPVAKNMNECSFILAGGSHGTQLFYGRRT